MDKVVITGGAGFIGSHLAQSFVEDGFRVLVLDNLTTGHRKNLDAIAADIEFVEGDICDTDTVEQVMQGARWVLHHAAMVSVPESVEQPERCHTINGGGTVNVLQAARRHGVEALSFAASAAAYGTDPRLPKTEDMAPAPRSPYAATKLYGEHCAATWSRVYDLPCVPLRYFNIYGERQDPKGPYAAVISAFVDRMMAGVRPRIFGDGSQTRDFCHVSDVVQANRRALERATTLGGEVINVATGRQTSLLDLVETLNQVLGIRLEPEFAEERAGDIPHSVADISRARALLDYEPRVSLHQGLGRLVASLGGE